MTPIMKLTLACLQLLGSLLILTPVVAVLVLVAKLWWTIAIVLWGTW